MALIEKLDKVETETFSVTIPRRVRDDVQIYAGMTNRTTSDLIGIMLEKFMEKDKDFQAFKLQNPGPIAGPPDKKAKAKTKTGSHRTSPESGLEVRPA